MPSNFLSLCLLLSCVGIQFSLGAASRTLQFVGRHLTATDNLLSANEEQCLLDSEFLLESSPAIKSAAQTFDASRAVRHEGSVVVLSHSESNLEIFREACNEGSGYFAPLFEATFWCTGETVGSKETGETNIKIHNGGLCLANTPECAQMDPIVGKMVSVDELESILQGYKNIECRPYPKQATYGELNYVALLVLLAVHIVLLVLFLCCCCGYVPYLRRKRKHDHRVSPNGNDDKRDSTTEEVNADIEARVDGTASADA
mmetsp:Transcript_15351/g.24882  ORF Transcript_15351/g.24882 Transcript_15351/m.24882 type:complete len:259 (+) Transcript_15351:364-1140(+)|eukprot:CAMPEP_0178789162 /NCGR_PEP_ID=MMETSP0745-20121128/6756_1 /TAXON_ID=913974 /ORGANISM="Nitzschia punctata, Strain CCMP561" /LENGTH=258 /DNA_ID=CAMNT_0020447091 /DNA_START=268 /DNA_END=1044 /DNA_ORIENTATION=+